MAAPNLHVNGCVRAADLGKFSVREAAALGEATALGGATALIQLDVIVA